MNESVKTIMDKINNGAYINESANTKEFGGADVLICKKAPHIDTSKTIVETQFSKEISWLFEQMRDAYKGKYDYLSKFEFFGRMADAANSYIAEHGDTDVVAMMKTVINGGVSNV